MSAVFRATLMISPKRKEAIRKADLEAYIEVSARVDSGEYAPYMDGEGRPGLRRTPLGVARNTPKPLSER